MVFLYPELFIISFDCIFRHQKCPSGLAWSSMKSQCDWANKVNCGNKGMGAVPGGNSATTAPAGPKCSCPGDLGHLSVKM